MSSDSPFQFEWLSSWSNFEDDIKTKGKYEFPEKHSLGVVKVFLLAQKAADNTIGFFACLSATEKSARSHTMHFRFTLFACGRDNYTFVVHKRYDFNVNYGFGRTSIVSLQDMKQMCVKNNMFTVQLEIFDHHSREDDARLLRMVYNKLYDDVAIDSASGVRKQLSEAQVTIEEQQRLLNAVKSDHEAKLKEKQSEMDDQTAEWKKCKTKLEEAMAKLDQVVQERNVATQKWETAVQEKIEMGETNAKLQQELSEHQIAGALNKKRKRDVSKDSKLLTKRIKTIVDSCPLTDLSYAELRAAQECFQQLASKATEAVNNLERCTICTERLVDCILMPCGHRRCCTECITGTTSVSSSSSVSSKKLRVEKCPFCRLSIDTVVSVWT